MIWASVISIDDTRPRIVSSLFPTSFAHFSTPNRETPIRDAIRESGILCPHP